MYVVHMIRVPSLLRVRLFTPRFLDRVTFRKLHNQEDQATDLGEIRTAHDQRLLFPTLKCSPGNCERCNFYRNQGQISSNKAMVLPHSLVHDSTTRLPNRLHRCFSSTTDKNDELDFSAGTEHVGVVSNIRKIGAFVTIQGAPRHGLVHFSEISRAHRVVNPSMMLKVGQEVKVRVLENEGTRLRLSMKRVKPVLSSDFNPISVMVMGWPVDMEEREAYSFFAQYGPVEHISFPMSSIEEGGGRYGYIFATFKDRNAALECIKRCRKVSLEIGHEIYDYSIRARMAKEHTFKKRLQEKLDDAFQILMREWEMSPDDRRGERMARRSLRDLIPYYDDFHSSQLKFAIHLLDENEYRLQ